MAVGITRIEIKANLPWEYFKGKGGNWIAVCEPLKLTVQSETFGELMEDIEDTLDALFQDLLSSNELEKLLRDHGWTLTGQIPSRDEPVRFDIPFSTKQVASGSYV
jgi:predicted RNase H-like HicB family nuclease